jgi:hypothetical protein
MRQAATHGRRRLRPLPTALSALSLAGLALAPVAVAPPEAGAAPTCTTAGNTTTCAFTTVGTATWTVPPGITSATFDVFGAQGGTAGDLSGRIGAGGPGGEATATLTVTPGATYRLAVGGARVVPGAGARVVLGAGLAARSVCLSPPHLHGLVCGAAPPAAPPSRTRPTAHASRTAGEVP